MKADLFFLAGVLAMTLTAKAAAQEQNGTTVGICIYQFADDFISLYEVQLEKELEARGYALADLLVMNAAGSPQTQIDQIYNLIDQGVNILVVNPVFTSQTSEITDIAVEAGIPLIYFNREPSQEEVERWEAEDLQVGYVGCDPRQAGEMQAEILMEQGMDALDLNENGMLDYVLLKGDEENPESALRSQSVIESLEAQGIECHALDEITANFERDAAYDQVRSEIGSWGKDLEALICNNDAMAMGAAEAIDKAGRTVGEDIYLVGIDALEEALRYMKDGKLTGTVYNDYISQSRAIADMADAFLKKEETERVVCIDYIKVTPDNMEEILERIEGR